MLALGTALSYVRLPAFVPAIKAAHIIGTASLLLIPCAYKLVRRRLLGSRDPVFLICADILRAF